jgi:hypothetical protein
MPGLIGALVVTALILVWIHRDLSRRCDEIGRGPWNWPFGAWVAIALLSGLVAGVLYAIAAHRQDKRAAASGVIDRV